MGCSLFRKIGIAAFSVGVLALPNPANAIPVVDAGTHTFLSQIVAGQIETNAKLDTLIDLLSELVTSNDGIQEAIGPASSITSIAAEGFDIDAENISATIPDFGFTSTSEGMTIPDLRSNLADAENFVKDIYGVYTSADRKLRRTSKKVQGAVDAMDDRDPNKLYLSLKEISAMNVARKDTYSQQVTDSMTGALYSLSQGADAQSNEARLDTSRRGSSTQRYAKI